MNAPLRLLSVVCVSAVLSGCVIVAGDVDEFDRDGYRTNWQSIEKDNRAKIANLSLGANYDTVVKTMGQPNFSEAYEDAAKVLTNIMYERRIPFKI